MVILIIGLIALAIMGYVVETTSFGDKVSYRSNLVEAVDEDNPDQILIEKRKETWAKILYSFSL